MSGGEKHTQLHYQLVSWQSHICLESAVAEGHQVLHLAGYLLLPVVMVDVVMLECHITLVCAANAI